MINSLVYKHQKIELKKVEEKVHSKFASYLEAANKQDLEKEVLEGEVEGSELPRRESAPRVNEADQEDIAS